MDEQNQNLKAYFDKILEIQQSKQNRELSEDELHDIALSLGVSEADWQFVQKVFRNHKTRALGYLKFENWQDAIPEFEQALTLKPIDLESLYGMAAAYKFKWKSSHNNKDAQRAESYAKQCLEIQPDYQEALMLISSLRNKPNVLSKPISKSKVKSNQSIFILVVLLFLSGIIGFIFLKNNEATQQEAMQQIEEIRVAEPLVAEESQMTSSGTTEIPNPDYRNDNEGQIPVEFINPKHANKLPLSIEKSALANYNNKAYNYEFAGYLELKGVEIDLLKFRIELIDLKDNIVAVANEEIIKDYMPIFRNGDLAPVHFSIFKQNVEVPLLKKVRITVTEQDTQISDAKFATSPEIPINWAFRKPANFEIAVRERNNLLNELSYNKDKTNHNLVIEVQNTGNSTIQGLKMEIQWVDAKGNILSSKDKIITYGALPKIKRGQTRLDWFIETIDVPFAKVKGYKLNVISIE